MHLSTNSYSLFSPFPLTSHTPPSSLAPLPFPLLSSFSPRLNLPLLSPITTSAQVLRGFMKDTTLLKELNWDSIMQKYGEEDVFLTTRYVLATPAPLSLSVPCSLPTLTHCSPPYNTPLRPFLLLYIPNSSNHTYVSPLSQHTLPVPPERWTATPAN
jgi:hypothetical protein